MARELLPAGNAANPLVLTLIIISVPGSGGGLNRVLLGLDWKCLISSEIWILNY